MKDRDAEPEAVLGMNDMPVGTQTSRATRSGGLAPIRPILRVFLLAVALPCLFALPIAIAVPLSAAANMVSMTATIGDPQFDGRTVDREIASFRAAAISLQQAMTIAQQRHADARIADVSFDGSSDRPVYKVMTLYGDHVLEHSVDAETGAVVGGEIVTPLSALDAEDRKNLVALKRVRQQLAEAIVVAERVTSGRAISGGLMSEAGKLSFAIVVVSDDGLKQVILEPPRAAKR